MNETTSFENNLPCEAEDFDYDEIDRRLGFAEPGTNTGDSRRTVQEAVIRVLCLIRDSDNFRLQLDAVCCAFGLNVIEAVSYEVIAAKHGITRQGLSKKVLKIQRDFGIPPNRRQKSIAARKAYSVAMKKSWRRV